MLWQNLLYSENTISFKFDEDSELEIINKYAFAGTYLEDLIEIHVKIISEFAFNQCQCLVTIHFK